MVKWRFIVQSSPSIFISAGEASGDLLGGHLAQALRTSNPACQLIGMGGEQMRAAGVELIEDLSRVGVVGIIEVLSHLGGIIQVTRKLKRMLKAQRPDLVILIDYPGLHLHLAEYAKKIGLQVLFYVSPQIWGWRSGRIKRIKACVDHMAVLYPFEKEIYDQAHVPATFVGHPLKTKAVPSLDQPACFQTLHLDPSRPVVVLMPGSREQEIKRLLPIMLAAKTQIQAHLPNCQFAIPLAQTIDKHNLKKQIPVDIHLIENNTYNLLSIARCALAASGTATLEVALLGVPMAVTYKLAATTYWILKRLVKLKYISLCNIIAGEGIVKEFIQDQATPEALSTEIIRILSDDAYRELMKQKLGLLNHRLGTGDPSLNTAKLALELIPTQPTHPK